MSCNLKRDTGSWLQSLKTEDKTLHILIHDEAHWGLAKRSKITNFFDEVRTALDTHDPRRFNLVTLSLSATPWVLTHGLEMTSHDREVNWCALRKEAEWATPDYTHIADLNYSYDPKIAALQNTKEEATASLGVVQEYLESTGKAKLVLDALTQASNEKTHQMAVVRLMTIAHAVNLVKDLNVKVPFSVVGIYDKSPLIYNQLKETEKAFYEKGDLCLGDLTKGVFLVVVVGCLRMGDRVPPTCMFWDVRCRYRDIINSYATFVQDVGRCAGHKKPKAEVMLGVDVLPQKDVADTDPSSIRKLDQFLKPNNSLQPGKVDEELFKGLEDCMVVLTAEPQIGKTGAVLSMVQLMVNSMKAQQVRELILLGRKQALNTSTGPAKEIGADFIAKFEAEYRAKLEAEYRAKWEAELQNKIKAENEAKALDQDESK